MCHFSILVPVQFDPPFTDCDAALRERRRTTTRRRPDTPPLAAARRCARSRHDNYAADACPARETALAAVCMAAPTSLKGAAAFVPRAVFDVSSSITRTYFLGHHAAALANMRRSLSDIGLVIECRDSRVPLASANPLLDEALAGRPRVVVYTKAGLCAPPGSGRWIQRQQLRLQQLRAGSLPAAYPGVPRLGPGPGGEGEERADDERADEYYGGRPGLHRRAEVVFTDKDNLRSVEALLAIIKRHAAAAESLTGLRALVVGMPNAGKSTLLNLLRHAGMSRAKAARTGAQPGVTRSFGTPVRIVPAPSPPPTSSLSLPPPSPSPSPPPPPPLSYAEEFGGGVYLIDTPGVFVPYVADPEAMLKLSLVGCVRDGIVPSETLADYLLFHLNRRDPALYADFCSPPTNDGGAFLDAVARRTGKLARGGVPSRPHAADWVVQRWRAGALGRFPLDDLDDDATLRAAAAAAAAAAASAGSRPLSLHQARKREKEARKERRAAKRGRS
ncbi:P-loop containing nucleoside triphosphate hydrolase protein [Durotheca rogersii]|uniref:P-loop containing nucleoside triphosphate hydrolase protein n=1 Tax=Durotheca rogersii TaxID=419775 RepID=UPI00221F142A|nr:P-loop containing nucleoside triphosphate hydrolase protein [Durotheca rogersii]KAI5867857.1 P-loop containing nucleoside triphosphate hydrolase protein [Durotheca rogersii]